ncbi:MAG TPA: FG-GAP-like repeat-containing protein, partial [Isosphaeraceae bacterium]|nr:FG-GAP-like repeat-containing protein [Isosphaeraceae bacterium]
MMRRSITIVCLIVGACALTWVLRRSILAHRYADGLEQARGEVASGHFAEARRWLADLPENRKSDPEVADLLGTCEHAAGHYKEALDAWAKVAPGSPGSARVALARARTLTGDFGRYADAEPILEAALREPGPNRLEIRHTLSQLYFTESRYDAMRRVVEDGWQQWRDPAAEVRHLWLIDDAPVQVGPVRKVVDEAAAKAPDDDRVWLAQAGLDRLEGRFDEARRRLEACTRRRPDDPAVWLARLRLARSADDPGEATRALEHIPADALREADWLDLRAWLAEKAGDREEQRRSLEDRIKIGPADPAAFERLAVLCYETGQSDRAAELRRRKAELDGAKDRYRRLLAESTPTEGFAELARLAETLGRPFEAYNWWELAARRDSTDADATAALARLASHRSPDRPPASAGSLAERLAGRPSAAVATVPAVARSVVPSFRDDAEAAGLRFTFDNGASPLRQLPETTAGGVGLLDYNGDGRLDVYLVQGGPFPPRADSPNTGDRLFRNRGDGTFEDVSEAAGISRMPRGYGHGVAVGDVDNDGHPDLFITRWRSYALYRNRGDGTFEDATSRFGLAGDRGWPTSAALADLDNDGDLDLYVCHYLKWDAEHPPLCPRKSGGGSPADPMLRFDYCMPHPFPSEPDRLYRNDGGRFVDVTAEAGIVDANGRGLGVVAADVDEDGLVDLFVANDTT